MGWKYIALLGFLKAQELLKPKASGYQTTLRICISFSCVSIPTGKKEQRKNSSQHIQSSSGSRSYMTCKIYKKILLVFQSPLLHVTDTIRDCAALAPAQHTHHGLYRRGQHPPQKCSLCYPDTHEQRHTVLHRARFHTDGISKPALTRLLWGKLRICVAPGMGTMSQHGKAPRWSALHCLCVGWPGCSDATHRSHSRPLGARAEGSSVITSQVTPQFVQEWPFQQDTAGVGWGPPVSWDLPRTLTVIYSGLYCCIVKQKCCYAVLRNRSSLFSSCWQDWTNFPVCFLHHNVWSLKINYISPIMSYRWSSRESDKRKQHRKRSF